MFAFLSRLRTRAVRPPFDLVEVAEPDAAIDALFQRAFGTVAPRTPKHFIARFGDAVAGYIHYTPHEPGVYLCGGLCVDARIYRALTAPQRTQLRDEGSLSRWMINLSVDQLPSKKAVFAYTGHTMSVRDALAVNCIATSDPHLFVQWHETPVADREPMVRRIAAVGPF